MTDQDRLNRIELEGGKAWLLWRKGSGPTVEIYDIHVDGEVRRKGLGSEMVRLLIKKLPEGVNTVWAITRTSNEVAQLFYERNRFYVSGVLRRFYLDESRAGADAIVYTRVV